MTDDFQVKESVEIPISVTLQQKLALQGRSSKRVVYFTKNLGTRATTKQDPANIDPWNEASILPIQIILLSSTIQLIQCALLTCQLLPWWTIHFQELNRPCQSPWAQEQRGAGSRHQPGTDRSSAGGNSCSVSTSPTVMHLGFPWRVCT